MCGVALYDRSLFKSTEWWGCCSALDAAISYITASAISPFEVHFGDFLGTRNGMSFPSLLLPSIVGILGMAISGPGHDPEPPMRRSFDRSQDFLPRE